MTPHSFCPIDDGQVALAGAQDAARAGLYALLAGWLLGPDAWALDAVRRLLPWTAEDDSPLARAWIALAHRSHDMTPQELADEHARLFVAAGTPAVDPYQSRYLHGCLMDRSLVALRHDLGRLGLARSEGWRELEDHLGALCESMQLLIDQGQPLPVQARFFERHLAPWYADCLADIADSPHAAAYRDFAALARAFLDEEAQALRLELDERTDPDPGPTAQMRPPALTPKA